MKIHELKTWPEEFVVVVNGFKRFEFRKDDRGFEIGDVLLLKCYDPEEEQYLGGHQFAVVDYITKGGAFGIPKGYVIMGITRASLSVR